MDRLPGIRRYLTWAALLLVFGAVALPFDFWWSKQLVSHLLPSDLARALQLSEIFGHGMGVLVILTGLYMLQPRLRRFVPRVATCAILPGLLANLFKIFVGRLRPGQFGLQFPESNSETFLGLYPARDGTMNLEHVSQSFPSAHTATAFGLAVGLTWLYPRGKYFFFGVAIVASIQRVAFQAHWMSDVFAGAFVGVLLGGALTQAWGLGYLLGFLERPAVANLLPKRSTEMQQHLGEQDVLPDSHDSLPDDSSGRVNQRAA